MGFARYVWDINSHKNSPIYECAFAPKTLITAIMGYGSMEKMPGPDRSCNIDPGMGLDNSTTPAALAHIFASVRFQRDKMTIRTEIKHRGGPYPFQRAEAFCTIS